MVFDPPRALIQFLHQAEAAGMPVRFLRNVLPRYRFWVDSHGEQENSVIMIFDFMSLSRRTLRGASEFRTSSAVQTLYHEFTHAHIDLHEDGVGLRHLWPSAVRHYERQRTRGNRRVSDPERVAHEAAAAYTGWRAGKWHSAWLAMTELRAALADNVDHTRVQELLDGIAGRTLIPLPSPPPLPLTERWPVTKEILRIY